MRWTRLAPLLLAALLILAPGARASQSTLTTPSAPLTMAQLATFLNNAHATIATNYSGATPPAVCTGGTACTYQFWLDTSTSPRILRMYDGASWVPVGTLDTTAHSFSVTTGENVNPQSGATYTYTDADRGYLVRRTNAGAMTDTLPQAGAGSVFVTGWFIDVRSTSTGTVTITPTTSTIDGAATLTLPPGRGVRIISDGTNYFTGPQIGTPTTAVLGGVFSKAAVASNWLRSLGTDGIFTASQPAFSDLSGSSTCAQLPALTGDVTTSAGACATTLVTAQPGAHTWALGQTFSAAMTYGGVTLSNAVTGTGSMVLSASPTITGTLSSANHTITSASANALAVGLAGTTNPAFNVDAATASSATGINVKSAAAAGGVAISVLSSGTDENLKIDAKGAGTISIGSVSTGAITLTRATTLSAALTYGGVALSNAVTGTGNMVLSASPTLTGTLTASVGSFSSTLASTAHTITSTSASALAVGPAGATNPTLQVDASTASAATGLKVKGAAAAGGLALSVVTSGTNENLTIDAAGSGTITLGATSTGAITLTRATTLSAALTYGGVTLSNSVTGTGSMVLATSAALVTPALGVATGTSLALGGCTIGTDGFCITGTATHNGNLTVSGGALIISGNQSASTWTTSGIRIRGVAATLTDTTAATGTTATAYTNVLGGNTIAATNVNVVFTNYFTTYTNDPIAGNNVTLTNKWALGADSAKIGTSNQFTVSTAGAVTIGAALTYGGVTLSNAVTGTGSMVLSTSPALTTPNIGVATATSVNKVAITAPATSATLTIADGKTLTASNSLTFTGTDGNSFAFPSGSDTVVTLAATQTLSAKSLTAPITTGLADVQGAMKFSTQSAPAQIAANQNDYNPSSVNCATSQTLLINSDAARNITGLAGPVAGCQMALINNGSFTITLKEQDAGSSAANRFNTGADISLTSSAGVLLRYDSVASRWRLLGATGGGGGGSGTVTSVVAADGLSGGTITTSGTIKSNYARQFMLPL